MNVYLLIDSKNKDLPVGVFDKAKDIVNFFKGKSIDCIYSAMSRGNKIKNRYEIIKVNIDEETDRKEDE